MFTIWPVRSVTPETRPGPYSSDSAGTRHTTDRLACRGCDSCSTCRRESRGTDATFDGSEFAALTCMIRSSSGTPFLLSLDPSFVAFHPSSWITRRIISSLVRVVVKLALAHRTPINRVRSLLRLRSTASRAINFVRHRISSLDSA